MAALLIGYARCSTDQQDLTAQRDGLTALGVSPGRIYVDHGLTGTTRDRPGLREAMAACREGDTLVVTKLDRLARSLPDARAIADERAVPLRAGWAAGHAVAVVMRGGTFLSISIEPTTRRYGIPHVEHGCCRIATSSRSRGHGPKRVRTGSTDRSMRWR